MKRVDCTGELRRFSVSRKRKPAMRSKVVFDNRTVNAALSS